jgi:hypothetical protein
VALVALAACDATAPPLIASPQPPPPPARPFDATPPLPVAAPTPGSLAVDRRGLPCVVRSDGLVACDRFARPASLFREVSAAKRVVRSEEWICISPGPGNKATGTVCSRGEDREHIAVHDRVVAKGRVVCNLGDDHVHCFGPGARTSDEHVRHRLDPALAAAPIAAVDDGLLCWHDGSTTCLELGPTPSTRRVEGPALTALDLGGGQVCGIDEARQPWCAPADQPLAPVTGAPKARAIAVGLHHVCVLTDAGGVACWRHLRASDEVPYVIVLPIGDVVAIDADGPFTVTVDTRRGLHRWRIGPASDGPLSIAPMLLPGLDNPTPPATDECRGCQRITTLGDDRCVKEPVQSPSDVTTYTECGARCCWVPPGWSQ